MITLKDKVIEEGDTIFTYPDQTIDRDYIEYKDVKKAVNDYKLLMDRGDGIVCPVEDETIEMVFGYGIDIINKPYTNEEIFDAIFGEWKNE